MVSAKHLFPCEYHFLLLVDSLTILPIVVSSQARIRVPVSSYTPRMLQHLADRNPLLDITVQHQSDQVNALLAHDPRNAQVVVHNLVNGVERIFLVDDGVQQDTEGPHILLFATVRATSEDLWGGVVCEMSAYF